MVSFEHHREYRFGAFTLDLDRGVLLENGEEIPLRPKSFDVLRYLVERPGILVTREKLLEAVWPDVVVTDDSLTQCLIDVRRALGDDERTLVRTVPRRGFIFELPVELASGHPDETTTLPRPSGPIRPLFILGALAGALAIWWVMSSMPHQDARRAANGDAITPAARQALPSPTPGNPLPVVPVAAANSIAILTFDDLSPEGDNAWFAQGLSEEVRNLLATLPQLKVIGRSSSSAVNPDVDDLRTIGQRLEVRHVLEGSVRKTGELVRISVQLVETRGGSVVWSRSFQRDMTDIFALQEEVATELVDAMELHLAHSPVRGLPTHSADAYARFLKARLALTIQDGATAEAELRQAVALDPNFAEAWELLAHTYWTEPVINHDPDDLRQMMRHAAGQAIKAEPGLDFARALLIEGNEEEPLRFETIEAYAKAAERPAGNPAVLRTLSWHLIWAGYFAEGATITTRMVDTDPLSSIAHVRHASALGALGRSSESRAALETAHQLSAGGLDWYLGESDLVKGKDESAIRHFEKFLGQSGVTDVAWIRRIITGLRDGSLKPASFDKEIPEIVSSLPAGLEAFMQPALSRWHFFFGHLDRYYEIILDEYPADPRWTNAEHYIWYGMVFRELGFSQHPRYAELSSRAGLTRLWNRRGAPDHCIRAGELWQCH